MKKKNQELTTTKDGLQMLNLRDADTGNQETIFVRKNADGTIYLHVGYTQINLTHKDAKSIINMLQTALR